MDAAAIEQYCAETRIKTVEFLCYGDTIIEVWYYSPLPTLLHGKVLYVCPFCLSFFSRRSELEMHSEICEIRCPPGDEIYRDQNLSVFELDNKSQKLYTENLCYIAKCFLDHKFIDYELPTFQFYILCERKADGYYLIGYFSKEMGQTGNNLSCIMTLPSCQG